MNPDTGIVIEEGAAAPHVVTTSSLADERYRVLKHADTFAVLDHHGRIKFGGLGEEGLYHHGTRYMSQLYMELEGKMPIVLGSTVRGGEAHLVISLANPDIVEDGRVRLAFGTLHFAVTTFLWNSVFYHQIRITNYGLRDVEATLSFRFDADYADIFEIRGMKRQVRGELLPVRVTRDGVILGYRGLDHVARHTEVRFTPQPVEVASDTARFELALKPHGETTLSLSATCRAMRDPAVLEVLPFHEAQRQSQAEAERYNAWSCHLQTSSGQMNTWTQRALDDLQLMTTNLPTGHYPYAGVPWFNTPFGRDGIVTALQCLWMRPQLARGVLNYLAATQATREIPYQDAEPGKILHETRQGEMAVLGEMPFGQYYGSVDATPLFVLLAGDYYQRTADLEFVRSIWPNIEAALRWVDVYGDCEGDGFTRYRRSRRGLQHQGWKDSDDAVFHADGTAVTGAIALCEVQGYVYAARRAAATVASALGRHDRAVELMEQARTLQEKFDQAFWCEELATYAVAIDGAGRQCRVRTSNAGHCLYCGIASVDKARRLARTLLLPESFSGWGVRTVATPEAAYNPMSYHNGSIWPHDNALIASGLARYGFGDKALQLFAGHFEAGMHFELQRMPELFCGFTRQPGEAPVMYPVACSPQAWSAASVLLFVQACLGLGISAVEHKIYFTRPQMPDSVRELRIHNLEVAGSSVDLLLTRQEFGMAVNVIRREGNVQVVTVK